MRKDLNMSPAKLAVQVGHGTQYLLNASETIKMQLWWSEWDSRKIVCEVSSEEKLLNLLEKIRAHVVTCEIIDSGYTEFDGKTRTGICFLYDDEADSPALEKIIKRLQLYKG